MTKTNQSFTPFSNGTEAMIWYAHNCDRCVKAYRPKDPNNWPKDETMRQYISCGKECKFKYHLDWGHITGEIPMRIAEEMGYTEEKCVFPSNCMYFSDSDDDRYKAPKRPKPDNTPPNQMVMPFMFQELGIQEHKPKEMAVNA